MHLVPAPAVRLMKRRVLSRPGVPFPTVIILVWDLIVGSLVEISDARRLFPHFWFSAGGRKVIPEVPCLVFVSWL